MRENLSVPVCILEAGPVGGMLACCLANAGIAVALIDHAPLQPMEHSSFDGRAYAVAAGSRTFLEDAGLWDTFDVPPNPIRNIRVSDGRVGLVPSLLHLHFGQQHALQDSLPFGWMIEARSLRKALNKRLQTHDRLRLFAPARARVAWSDGSATVSLDSGPTVQCDLVIAAQGRNSALRDQAHIRVTRIPYDQTAIVCAIAHEQPHHDLALEHFLPGGPFAVLPMPPSTDALIGGAEHLSAVVWTERTERAGTFLGLDNERFTRELRRRLGPHLGQIHLVGRRWSYPLSAMIAHRYIDTRLALIGDAAHGIHPIAGQGLNLGFRDGMALANLIIEANRAHKDVGTASLLAQYQRVRRADNLLMYAITDGVSRLFSSDLPLARVTRDLGISGINRFTAVKQLFIRSAVGKSPPEAFI